MEMAVVRETEGHSAIVPEPEQYQRKGELTAVTSGDECNVDWERKLGVASSSPIIEFFEDPEEPGFRTDDIDRKCFTCSYCGRKFARRQTLEQHERIHTGEKPFRCSECNKCFRQRSALRVHRKGHAGDKAFECFVCCKRFYRSGDLKAHLGIHTGVREHNCSICLKGFGRPSDLRRHMQTHEAEPVLFDIDKSPHECSQCGKKFTRHAQVEIHQRVHTGEKPYQCTQCGESFRWRQNFKAHQRNHTCEKPYHCSDCDRRFTCLSALEKHQVMLHSGVLLQNTQCHQSTYKEDTRHQCCQCGKSFSQAKDLVVHQRVHTGEKPYKCTQCGKRFRQIGHLKEHQRVHSGEKPYQCSVCYKCFPYSQSMKKHMRVIHGALQHNTEEKNWTDDVEEVKIGSAPTSPSSIQSDDPGASDELSYHIKSEDQRLPFAEDVDTTLCSLNSDLSGDDAGSDELAGHRKTEDSCLPFVEGAEAQHVKTEESFPLEEDVMEANVCSSPSSTAKEFTKDCEVFNEPAHPFKTEKKGIMEDSSAFSSPASELSKYPEVFDQLVTYLRAVFISSHVNVNEKHPEGKQPPHRKLFSGPGHFLLRRERSATQRERRRVSEFPSKLVSLYPAKVMKHSEKASGAGWITAM
ncbi:zinc finger protein 271-like isoform X1 [Pygocentrus nattereri]|uniref:zinc finger protein 271-like isoform X1 n=1 Tax=Pygocentrus nattereri TaxID=42514 RepID=UPI001891711A|nr:zinc finger protein 271-like isoform X1 [Pygocentrus nattereri]